MLQGVIDDSGRDSGLGRGSLWAHIVTELHVSYTPPYYVWDVLAAVGAHCDRGATLRWRATGCCMPTAGNQMDLCLTDCQIGMALDGLCVGLVLTNASGKVIWINRAARNVLGTHDRSILGQSLQKTIKDPQLVAFWQQAVRSDGTEMAELSVSWPQAMELKVNAAPCLDTEGNVIARALLCCDVTRDRAVRVEMSQAVARQLLRLAEDKVTPGEPIQGLTRQELLVLRLVGRGLSNREVADEVSISISTVRSHIKHIYRKLGLSSRAEAVSYAVQHGLV